MVSHRERFEISAGPHPLTSGPTPETHTAEILAPATSGRKVYIWVAVSFGLLCILQAGLNVSLRLFLDSSDTSNTDTSAVEASGPNETVVSKARVVNSCDCSDLNPYETVLLESEKVIKKLRSELDQIKRPLVTFDRDVRKGWVYFPSSLYWISSQKKSWQDSRDYCLKYGADLVIIDSKEEQDFIGKFHGLLWIGLREAGGSENWKWVDGTPLMRSRFWDWLSPQSVATVAPLEMCMATGAARTREWKKSPCFDENFWICEKNINLWRPTRTPKSIN